MYTGFFFFASQKMAKTAGRTLYLPRRTGAMHRVGATPTENTMNTMNTRRGTWLRESHGLWKFRGTWLAESPIPGPISLISPIGPISLPASPSFLRNALCFPACTAFGTAARKGASLLYFISPSCRERAGVRVISSNRNSSHRRGFGPKAGYNPPPRQA